MPRVIISKAAREDLVSIRTYIQDELLSPDAARNTIQLLRKTIEGLREFPECGTPLDTVLSVHTDFRFLVCKNYRIFYLFGDDNVEVVRILHTLQDYMRALFL